MSVKQKFTEHPASVGETYAEHFATAMGFSLSLLSAACCCALHALLPFTCQRTGSDAIGRLHERMVLQRNRAATGSPGTIIDNSVTPSSN